MLMINRRYKIIDCIGQDRFGVFYKVQDVAKKNVIVTLKLLNSNYLTEDLHRYYAERFLDVTQLKHACVVGAFRYDLIRTIDNNSIERGNFFYVTEYIDPKILLDYQALSTAQKKHVIHMVIYALSYLHFMEMPYYQVVYDNIYIYKTDNGKLRVKLKDLPTVLTQNYALEELVNGVDSKNLERDAKMITQLIIDLIASNKNLAKQHGDLQMTLLKWCQGEHERDLSVYHLMQLLETSGFLQFPFKDRVYYTNYSFNLGMISRKEELESIRESISKKFKGESSNSCVIISGMSGIGKSRLIREIGFLLKTNGKTIVNIDLQGHNHSGLRLQALILRAVVSTIDIPRTLIDKYGGELVKLMPELSRKWKVTESKPLSGHNENLRTNNRLVQFLVDISSINTTVYMIENIHYIDSEEVKFLELMLSGFTSTNSFVLCTSIEHRVIESINTKVSKVQYEYIDISSLNKDEVKTLINSIFHFKMPVDNLIEEIFDKSWGIPRRIEDIIKYLVSCDAICLNDDRQWHFDVSKLDDRDLYVHLEETYHNQINRLSAHETHVINRVSIFEDGVERNALYHLINLPHETIENALDKLADMRLINIDVSYGKERVFFENKDIHRIIYSSLDVSERLDMHAQVATLLNKVAVKNRVQRIAYIYHLSKSHDYERAIEESVALAKELQLENQQEMAAEYLEMALAFALKVGDMAVAVNLLKSLADYHLWRGEYKRAEKQYETLNIIAKAQSMELPELDSAIRLLELAIIKSIHQDFSSKIERIATRVDKMKNHQLRFNLDICRFRLAIQMNDIVDAEKILKNMFLEKRLIDDTYNNARYQIARGILGNASQTHSRAFNAFNQAVRLLKGTLHSYELSYAYCQISIISYQIIGDFEEAERHILSAIDTINTHKIEIGRDRYLIVLGMIKSIMGQYTKAAELYSDAYQISKTSDRKQVILESLTHLLESELTVSKYASAELHLDALNILIDGNQSNMMVRANTRAKLAIVRYHTTFFDARRAITTIDNLMSLSDVDSDPMLKFLLYIERLICQYFMTECRMTYNVDNAFVERLITIASYPIERIALKRALLSIIFDMMCFDERDAIVCVINYYKQIDEPLNALNSVIKTSMIEKYLGQSSEIVDVLSNPNFKLMPQEDRWKVFLIIANYYALSGDYFKALRYYLESIDIIKDQYDKLSTKLGHLYIMNDALKSNIFDCVNILLNKVDPDFIEEDEFSIKALFNIKHFESTLVSKAFKASIKQNIKQKYHQTIDNYSEFLAALTPSHDENVKLMLLYITQQLLADNCHIAFFNDKGYISEQKSLDDTVVVDLIKVISERHIGEELVLENDKKLVSTDEVKQKSILFLPICVKTMQHLDDHNERRRTALSESFNTKAIIIVHVDSRLNNFTEQSIEVIRAFLPVLHLVIDNFLLYQTSTVDELTSTYLRKHIETLFAMMLDECRKKNESLSILMLDIDFFKRVNDTYGHQKGDDVLREVARIIKDSVRYDDAVGRYGGEEFIVLLPTADASVSKVIAERIRANVENANLLGNDETITISIGISVYPDMGNIQSELIEKADRSLYQSKDDGRNRVTIFGPHVSEEVNHYDRLTGIVTGNSTRDTRVIKTMLDIGDLIGAGLDKKTKIRKILRLIIDILGAEHAVIIVNSDQKIYGLERGKKNLKIVPVQHNARHPLYSSKIKRGSYILWEDMSEIDALTGKPVWKSYVQTNIVNNGKIIGGLKICVPITEREYDFKDYNVVSHITSMLRGMM